MRSWPLLENVENVEERQAMSHERHYEAVWESSSGYRIIKE